MNDWSAQCVDEARWLEMGGVRLHVYRHVGRHEVEALTVGEPTWTRINPVEAASDQAGIVLPRGCLAAVDKEIRRYAGDLRDSESEARVLREWLAVERGRVDRHWDRA